MTSSEIIFFVFRILVCVILFFNIIVLFQIIQVDKSVFVNRAALAEPSDVFVRSTPVRQTGNKMALPPTSHRRLSGSCPRMDSICEGSEEGASSSSSEGETTSTSLSQRRLPPAVRPPRSSLERGQRLNVRTGQQQREAHSFPRPDRVPKGHVSNGVEVGTNTPSVEQHDKCTSTDGMCQVVVDGKMAECISKLRTVRQRLEQQQPLTPRNTSPPDSASNTPPRPINDEHSPPRIPPQPINSEHSLPRILPDSTPNKPSPPRIPLNSTPNTPPQPINDGQSLPRIPSPTSSQTTLPPTVSPAANPDVVEQSCDQEDEVQQFISELKSRAAAQGTSAESSKRPIQQSVPGRRFVVDRKRAGNLSRPEHIPESPTSSPRPRRSTPTDRPSPFQRSYSPRARTRGGSTTAGTQETASPTQRRLAAAAKKLPTISSPPTTRSSGRTPPTRPQTSKSEQIPARSPGASPRNVRPSRIAATTAKQLATVDDEQAKSTSDSDSFLTHSGGSSDDQDPSGTARPPSTPKLARQQRLDMTQLLLVKSTSLPDQSTGGTTAVKQVRGSPTVPRRTNNPRQSHN